MLNHEEEKLLRKILNAIDEGNRHILGAIREETSLLRAILHRLPHPPATPTSISFQEISMLAPVAGNTLVFTGTLAPAGSAFPADAVFNLVSSDPTVSPTVDPTGLIVTIPLPGTFVDNPSSPFNVVYTATSASNPSWMVTSTITPSIPTPLPTGITFIQTT